MQFVSFDTPAEARAVRPAELELIEIDAFIEAQLKTGVLLINSDLSDGVLESSRHAAGQREPSSQLLHIHGL